MMGRTTIVAAALLWAGMAQAQEAPVTETEPDAKDVVAAPLDDLNLRKGEIPTILLLAVDSPYALNGLKGCRALGEEVARLDALLGADYDLADGPEGRLSAGDVGKAAVGSLIPFRGLIREVSGAAGEDRKLENAIRAGMARRGFLKGVGQARGCNRPARPATTAERAQAIAERNAEAGR